MSMTRVWLKSKTEVPKSKAFWVCLGALKFTGSLQAFAIPMIPKFGSEKKPLQRRYQKNTVYGFSASAGGTKVEGKFDTVPTMRPFLKVSFLSHTECKSYTPWR